MFEDTASSYTDVENLARLSCALRGGAREVAAALLVSTREPGAVLSALAMRFGRPELVVLQEVAAVRALPKVGAEGKDLATFAYRVRNCVEIIKLLNQSDYLRLPDLFQVLIAKLSSLLRTRWMDYASSSSDNETKIEMLADFLSREVEMQCRFGANFDISPPSLVQVSDNRRYRDRINVVAEN